METQFTKGKWSIGCGNYPSIIEVNIPGRLSIPMVFTATDLTCGDSQEIIANAHLIAAAPDMYEMLNDILCNYEVDEEVDKRIEKVLAKARGES